MEIKRSEGGGEGVEEDVDVKVEMEVKRSGGGCGDEWKCVKGGGEDGDEAKCMWWRISRRECRCEGGNGVERSGSEGGDGEE